MADKVSTLVLNVDLGCPRCYNKVNKILCKYRERDHIQKEIFDEKQNTVTISGPFCPKKLAEKLCCKAGGAIKCIEIIEKKPPKLPSPARVPTEQIVVPWSSSAPSLPPPCYDGCGRLPPLCYDGCERPHPCYCVYGRQNYVSPCCNYFSEEDPNSCIIM
ncbi:hypothetical protein NE237_002225 [Protea cynaroides]|uniref:Uncharacterized protein n=1 Tax=Protea cynaroides TaxID=273540 RepID=A0A9Q0KV22_9MAGN|nr:hypothetical protein NE237_002225 [Protea cynaroides]